MLELVVGTGVTAILTFAYLAYTGRQLGPSSYGDFSAALALIYFSTVVLGPVASVVARFSAIFHARDDLTGVTAVRNLMSSVVTRWSVVSLLASLAVAVFAPGLIHFIPAPSIPVVVVIVSLYTFAMLDRAILQGLRRFRRFNLSTLLEAGSRLVAAMLIYKLARSPVVALLIYAAALLLAVVFLRNEVNKTLRGVEPAPLAGRQLLQFGVPMLVLAAGLAAYQNIDMILVRRWFSPEEAGFYGAASALAKVMGVLVVPFYAITLPSLAALHARGKPIVGALFRLTAYFAVVASVAITLLYFFGGEVMTLAYGREFESASHLLTPLAGAFAVGYVTLLVAQAFATLQEFRFLYVYWAGVVVQLVALWRLHHSLSQVTHVLLVTQTLVAACVLALFGLYFRNRQGHSGATE